MEIKPFDFDFYIRQIIEFQMILPPRYTEELELLVLVSEEFWVELRRFGYRNGIDVDINGGTLFSHKWSIDHKLKGMKINPVWQRKVK